MRKRTVGETSAAVFGSMTQTMKAKSLLERAGIYTRLENADPGYARRGCSYALVFDAGVEDALRAVLRRETIRIRAIYPYG